MCSPHEPPLARDFRFDLRNQETHRINPHRSTSAGSVLALGGPASHQAAVGNRRARRSSRVTSASNVRSTTPRSEERALEEWVPLRFRLFALIAIGFRARRKETAGIGRRRAKTNGTESSNLLRSANESAELVRSGVMERPPGSNPGSNFAFANPLVPVSTGSSVLPDQSLPRVRLVFRGPRSHRSGEDLLL
jgi:hypothetical protein